MSRTNINRFLDMWNEDTLKNDVTWRGYFIMAAVVSGGDKYVKVALKQLGLGYAGEHGVRQFCALYDMYDVKPEHAEVILASWLIWSRLAEGRRFRGVQARKAPEAATLAEGSASPVVAPSLRASEA